MLKRVFIKGIPIVLFILGFALTLFLIQKPPAQEKPLDAQKTKRQTAPGVAIGEVVALPNIATLEGEPATITDVGEKGVICVLISVECANCSIDAQFWRDLSEESAKRGMGFYLISVDNSQVKVRNFVQAYGIEQLPVYFDPNSSAIQNLNVNMVPQYLLISANGQIMGRWDGVRRYKGKQQDFEKVTQMLQPSL
jgi:peroxiredoxin